ncbi:MULTISPECIES: ABC transporter ATP-binding protein [Clavibacter]|uniref:ABC-type quaternary amine transporter n=1 Tax=Clavibacter tessellarius TaxID=31965 RepID=A0A154UYQ9_9MICO|nr:ABC transporter ATP-binding protein [Clavibacter michiganensis]KZC94205.1 hypothetical protein AWH51_14170 [Clavibacter michiganensis subsp. tessellarius]
MTVIDAPAVPATAAVPALRLEGIGHRYGSTQAVADVSLEVAPGRVLALVGPSGCGKSTLLRLIAGLLTPSSGSLHLDGEDATRLRAERRRIGYVPQSYALFPHLSVRDNVAYGLRAQRVPRAERDERVDHALELTRMTAYADRSPAQLSGGQRQRVALARALAIRPRVLLLDEPLSALDPQLRDGMRRDLRRLLAEADCCTIIVTHDQAEALALADEVAVMRDGRLVQRDSVDGVWSRPLDPFVAEFVAGAAALPAMAADGELVVAEGWRMPLAPFLADGAAPVDGACFAVVRPVDGASLHERPVDGSRAAVIVDVEPRGSSWSLRLRLVGDGSSAVDGTELTVSSATPRLPGHAVHLRLDASGTTVHASPAASPDAAPPTPGPDARRRDRARTRGRRA